MKPKQLSVPGRFLATVEENALLASGDRVLAGVSGGADSVCLLDLLRLVRQRFRLTLAVFHLNHGLRDSSARDEEFVRQLCRDWRLELEIAHSDVAGYARRHKLGIEEAGRELRLRQLERAADRLACNRIALGHTANDNLETMLMNIVRGAGPNGLAGIRIRRGRFIRPLLDIERQSVEAHLQSRGITWVEDESNQDRKFRRNRLRHDVVPVLCELNPQVVTNARRAAALAARENDFLDGLATEAAARVARSGAAGPEIDTAQLAIYNECLKRRIIKQLLPELDASAVERVMLFVEAGRAGRLLLTAGVRARMARGFISFEHTQEITSDGR